VITDPDVVATVLHDAAHYPGGHAAGVIHVMSEADVAAALRLGLPVLAVGAQSSLTGGATPRGEIVLSTARLCGSSIAPNGVTAGAGLPLDTLQLRLDVERLRYPPVPTFTGATVGGVVACNAAGPATFKYGTTREWVAGLTVVLASGDVLDLERGQYRAERDGFSIRAPSGRIWTVPVVPLPRPHVPKCSAGYALAEGMDLIDLFIGAEGTLGIVTSATLRVLHDPPATCLAFIPTPTEGEALRVGRELREQAIRTWRERAAHGIDVAAIEFADARSVALLREEGVPRALDISLPPDSAALLFVDLDLPPRTTAGDAWTWIEGALEPGGEDTPLGRFCRLLHGHGLLDRTELALPGDAGRRRQLLALREAVPEAVNRRVAIAQREVSPALSKLAGDFIVPFDRLGEMLQICRTAFASRGLDSAIWGHFSDGNLHPNVIPYRADDLSLGRDALLEAARGVLALGGSPLAEHGVGRNPLKQRLLEMLYGARGVAAMRAVKHTLDSGCLLAPGVLLPSAE
jgi:D-lactate dehydrogenase (cytochrome)